MTAPQPAATENPAAGSTAETSNLEVIEVSSVERWAVVVLSLGMMVLPIVEVLLRRLTGRGVPGGAVYVQHFTLWLGFIGALAAAAAGKHLGLATHHLIRSAAVVRATSLYSACISAATCLVLTYAAAKVVQANMGGTAKLAGGIPQWWSELIVPATLAGLTLRFVWKAPMGWLGRAAAAGTAVLTALVFGLAGAKALVLPAVGAVVIGFIVGAPLFVAMSGVAMLLFFRDGTPVASVPSETLRLVQNPTLPAIPLLTLAGYILAAGKASQRLVRVFKAFFGWLPGGVALMVIMVCALFTTFTGGSGVTILALGGLLLPALLKDRYPEGFSLGLVTAAGSLGLLFPPSLPVILYGAVAGVSAQKLFLAGLVPGILMIVVVALYAVRVGIASGVVRQPLGQELRLGGRAEASRALWDAKWDLNLPVVVLGAFLSGWATIVEAAAMGAAYALVVELAIFRDVHPLREMPKVLAQSAVLVGAVVILLGVALGLTSYLVDAQIPEALVEWAKKQIHSPWAFLLALNAMLLVLGSVFEIYAAIIVLAPLVAPLGVAYNIDPIHLGVVFLANLELGFLFPPLGLNLFLSASRFNKPLPYLYKQALPFLLVMAVGVLIVTYVPALTTGVAAWLSR